MTITPAEQRVDGGLQRDRIVQVGIPAEQCVRGTYTHSAAVHPGFSFCRDCLAWLTEECDDDPLDDGSSSKSKQQTSPEQWRGYVEMLRGGSGM